MGIHIIINDHLPDIDRLYAVYSVESPLSFYIIRNNRPYHEEPYASRVSNFAPLSEKRYGQIADTLADTYVADVSKYLYSIGHTMNLTGDTASWFPKPNFSTLQLPSIQVQFDHDSRAPWVTLDIECFATNFGMYNHYPALSKLQPLRLDQWQYKKTAVSYLDHDSNDIFLPKHTSRASTLPNSIVGSASTRGPRANYKPDAKTKWLTEAKNSRPEDPNAKWFNIAKQSQATRAAKTQRIAAEHILASHALQTIKHKSKKKGSKKTKGKACGAYKKKKSKTSHKQKKGSSKTKRNSCKKR